MDDARIIGCDGRLPWHLPEDLTHFKNLTMGGIVIMGRKTWESLPPRFRPLPGRTNIVISRQPESLELPDGVLAVASPELAREMALKLTTDQQRIWVIGGAEIYRATLSWIDELHLTQVHGVHEGDARLPEFEDQFELVSQHQGEGCVFKVFQRCSEGENSELDTSGTS